MSSAEVVVDWKHQAELGDHLEQRDSVPFIQVGCASMVHEIIEVIPCGLEESIARLEGRVTELSSVDDFEGVG